MKLLSLMMVGILSLIPFMSAESAVKGTVKVDGSSTVFPITEAVAEEFGKEHRKVRVMVGVSGTGGGFKKFTVGESDINDTEIFFHNSK
ncbi:MAG: hypothetical protein E2O68_09850 [Deltaproteobacteria bacterium]|nr:MAG: hypothetical protein E2O68_09850 [Deltaproteobacteria bacterium]